MKKEVKKSESKTTEHSFELNFKQHFDLKWLAIKTKDSWAKMKIKNLTPIQVSATLASLVDFIIEEVCDGDKTNRMKLLVIVLEDMRALANQWMG